MKILFLIDNLGSGGKERQLIELINGLIKQNDFECELGVKRKEIHYKEKLVKKVTIHYLSTDSRRNIGILFRIYKLVRKFKPDIIHSWDPITSLYTLPLAKLLGIKFVNGYIRSATPMKRLSTLWLISKLTFKFSNAIVSNSLAGLKSLNMELSDKVYCIHNGFDFSRIENLRNPENIKRRISLAKQLIIGMVGNFADRKDYKTFLNSAKLLLGKRDDIVFVCIGNGPNLPEFKKLYANQSCNGQIRFLGKIADIESMINIFDIGVLTTNSKVHSEGISNAIMEYMALGKPVVATQCGGNEEVVVDNETGFLIKPFDKDELVTKLQLLLNNAPKRELMGWKGREKIKREFNLDNMIEKYENLYKKLITH